jgi:hypothetical protein
MSYSLLPCEVQYFFFFLSSNIMNSGIVFLRIIMPFGRICDLRLITVASRMLLFYPF